MNDSVSPVGPVPVGPSVQALPDGEAEVRLVVRLPWEDVAALGREAGRLAARLERPVTLDEAAGQRLRGRAAMHAAASSPAPGTAPDRGQQLPGTAPVSSLTGRAPGEHARQAIERPGTATGAGQQATPTSA